MDTNKALEKLESVRPDSADLLDPEFQQAAALIEANADLEAEFHRRQNTDRQIGEVMQNVVVPAGLKERLLSATGTQPPATPLKNGKRTLSRRMWLATTASVLATVIVGAFLIQFFSSTQFTLADLKKELPLTHSQITALPLSEAGYEKTSPSVGRLISIPGHSLPSGPAAYSFPANGTRCILVVMPSSKADVASLTPGGTVMFARGYTMTGWTEGPNESPLVCVLIVEGDTKDLEAVESRLRGITAA